MFKIHIIITRLKKKMFKLNNTDLYHCQIGEWINTIGDKQAFIILLAL